ncbi:hypothetical protein HZC31_03035 [Candidatus Woesearchaeota archaeon]|nr:hypothetical protein [Candidatus Woesearchaeota archaeon]
MTNYIPEAIGRTIHGIITVGSVAGYEKGRVFSFAETQDIVDKINNGFDNSVWVQIPCMIREEHLVGRTGGSGYREKLYRMTFAWSPRANPISSNSFFESLCEYAFRLGTELSQQRVYLDFDGKTSVFKTSNGSAIESERDLKSKAIAYLRTGRPHWDVPHTMHTVKWMKELVRKEGGNKQVLVSAMYLHDTGWGGMFDDQSCNYDTVSAGAELQARQSVERAREILTALGRPEDEIQHVLRLIQVHDAIHKIESPYEVLVLEADTLGQLSAPQNDNFGPKDYARFIAYVREQRAPKFRTQTGRKRLDELLEGK